MYFRTDELFNAQIERAIPDSDSKSSVVCECSDAGVASIIRYSIKQIRVGEKKLMTTSHFHKSCNQDRTTKRVRQKIFRPEVKQKSYGDAVLGFYCFVTI